MDSSNDLSSEAFLFGSITSELRFTYQWPYLPQNLQLAFFELYQLVPALAGFENYDFENYEWFNENCLRDEERTTARVLQLF